MKCYHYVYIYISYIDPDNWYVISTDDIGHQPQQPHQAPAPSGLRCLQPGRIPSMTSTIPKLIPHNLLKYHSPTAKKNAMGAILVRYVRDPAQLQHQVPEKIPEGSAADTSWGSGGLIFFAEWRYLLRLRRVLWGSGGFRCRYLWGSGSFRCRYSVRFRKVTAVQIFG